MESIAASEWFFLLIFPIVVVAGLLFLVRNYIKSVEWYDSDVRLEGKTVVITGGSSGLGKTLSVELARRGARVVVGCRTKLRRDSTAFYLRQRTGSFNIRTLYLDMARLDSVWEFARELVDSESRVDILINNAAVCCPQEWTSDSLDMMMGVNYVSHFLLVNLLAEKMIVPSGDLPRVLNIVCGRPPRTPRDLIPLLQDSSGKSTGGSYDIGSVYGDSKLAMYLLTKEIDKRFHDRGIMAYSVDPGPINSGLWKHLPGTSGELWRTLAKALYRTPEEAIQGILHVICAKSIEKEAGCLYKDGRIIPTSAPWMGRSASEVWEATMALVLSKGIKMNLADDEEDIEEEDEKKSQEE